MWTAAIRRISLTAVTVLLASVAALALAAAVWFGPILLYPPLAAADLRGIEPAQRIQLRQEQSKLQEDARLHLLQALGGLLLLAGAAATWRGVQVSREGQLTDRFTSAIEQLGSDKQDVRIGGIHALERIAVNSANDRATIIEILTAFIRGHAPWEAGSPASPKPHPTPQVETDDLRWLRDRGGADVQTALTVLGRQRTGSADEPRLELAMVDLRLAYMTRLQLSRVRLRRSNLAGCWMRQIHLDSSDLMDTDLRRAMLSEAHLRRANLQQAHLDKARLHGAQMRSARLVDARLRGADLRTADLTGADLRTADLRGADLRDARLDDADLRGCRYDAHTRWPDGYDPARLNAEGALPADPDETPTRDETPAGDAASAEHETPAGTAAPAEDETPAEDTTPTTPPVSA